MAVVELVPFKSFMQLWKELRKLGWTAKKPSGLGVSYRYIPPNGSSDGEEERDFFTDEAGSEIEGHDADTCDIDDDKDVLRTMSATGWAIFNEDVSSSCRLDEASDYYYGEPRPTKSARAFAESPLGLFFHFLPKLL
ncbi:hypothetical protein PINS_up019837 [Pythium insidiosum]|nr:hypothetical protein PINS_up017514 [Pythium insidiosum]GLE08501.1 hypothetical protein PINS_up019744 [Pythium insidiosum]GLE08562.1 hypothetical protein PINS_up019837 [Pythium insidiosum]